MMYVLGRREPSSIEREIVERYVGWSRVDGLPGGVLAAGIRDVDRVRESKIRLRRGAHTDAAAKLDVLVLRNFEFGLVEVECWIDLLQQFLDLLLEETVLALAHVRVDDIAVLVDQVIGWPALVVKRVPDFVVAIDRDRKIEAEALGGVGDPLGILAELELGRMHADDHQPQRTVELVPAPQVGEGANTVDAGVFPEVDQHHFAAQIAQLERRVVKTSLACEVGRRRADPLDRGTYPRGAASQDAPHHPP